MKEGTLTLHLLQCFRIFSKSFSIFFLELFVICICFAWLYDVGPSVGIVIRALVTVLQSLLGVFSAFRYQLSSFCIRHITPHFLVWRCTFFSSPLLSVDAKTRFDFSVINARSFIQMQIRDKPFLPFDQFQFFYSLETTHLPDLNLLRLLFQ